MSMLVKVLLVIALVLSIVVPFGYYFLGEKSRNRYKRSLGCNCFFFFGTLALAAILAFGGQVQAASAALGAISEDQSVFGKSMIFVAMAEGIALYGLIISFMILGKL